MNKFTSLKTRVFFRLVIPVIAFIIFETIISFFVTLHYANKAYDHWLLNSAHSLIQEIKVIDNKIYIDLPKTAQEIFQWDDVDETFFNIITENKVVLAGDQFVPELQALTNWELPVFSNEILYGESVRMVSIRVPGNLPENIYIHVAETLIKRQDMMFEILLADLLPQLSLSLLIGLFLFKGVNSGLAPLHEAD